MKTRKMPDCSLGEPQKKFSETFSVIPLLIERFVSEMPSNKNAIQTKKGVDEQENI